MKRNIVFQVFETGQDRMLGLTSCETDNEHDQLEYIKSKYECTTALTPVFSRVNIHPY
jgi:hypothetical protein